MELKTIFFESPYALPGERPRTAARGFCLNSSPQDPPSCRWLQARRPAEAVRPCSQKRARCEARYRVENVSHRERHTHGEARARFDCPPAFVLPPRRIARSRFARSDGVPPSTIQDRIELESYGAHSDSVVTSEHADAQPRQASHTEISCTRFLAAFGRVSPISCKPGMHRCNAGTAQEERLPTALLTYTSRPI